MPLINEGLKSNQQTENFQQQNFNQTAQANDALQPKGIFQIPENLLRLIPWIPIGLEMLTGQKIPATGVLADILGGIQQLQFQVSQISTQQQQIWSELKALESNASSQLTNLSQQLTNTNNNFRLIAQETKRHLELSSQPKELTTE